MINITDYFNPSQEILSALEDTFILYQLQNQDVIEIYNKWKDKDYYKGDIYAYSEMINYQKYLKLNVGKPWEPLLRGIWLEERFSTMINFAKIALMSPEVQQELTQMAIKGIQGQYKIKSWLNDLDNSSREAVTDAAKLTIGVGKYIKLQVLEIGEIDRPEVKSSGNFKIFNDILEIQHPEDLAMYLKHKKDLTDCLIITFKRNLKYSFKLDVIMFLIFGNKLYTVDIGDRRLNQENTEGLRNPGRYVDRSSEGIWLPYWLLLDKNLERPNNLETALALPQSTVWKVGTVDELKKQYPSYIHWLTIVLFRLMDYILDEETVIEPAVTAKMALKMLEDKSKTIPYNLTFNSQASASSHLIKKLGSKITSIVPSKANIISIIGTQEYVTGVIDYERRRDFAKQLDKEVQKDWMENKEKSFEWFTKLVKSKDVEDLARRALLDGKYPRKYFHSFGGGWINRTHYTPEGDLTVIYGKEGSRWGYQKPDGTIEYLKNPDGTYFRGAKLEGVFNSKILSIIDHEPWWIYGENKSNQYVIPTEENCFMKRNEKRYREKVKCSVCGKFEWTKILEIEFVDYRQLCAFFEISPDKIHPDIKIHLHKQTETYTGNSKLDDTDPCDDIDDPWFRGWTTNEMVDLKGNHKTETRVGTRERLLGIGIPLCGHCLRKLKPKEKLK